MIRVFTLFAASLVLAGCAYLQDVYADGRGFESGADPYEKIQFAGETASASERAACEAAGGMVARDGLLGWDNLPSESEDLAAEYLNALTVLAPTTLHCESTRPASS